MQSVAESNDFILGRCGTRYVSSHTLDIFVRYEYNLSTPRNCITVCHY